ncbi:aspartate 4-decarboxylase [Clostridium sp. 19966]|uniref:aspartate 4-decarboxylase n=1 Tax=Clostridium sp. 19966 TaxID=2768166 RepID=UPI0028DFF738|nr:aspartate 4-decarboxylase [Clostridium sp. 19966]MDT8717328.1 aspartate 4-decarboxylase [Clostridium sp. 19966]
MNTRNVQRREIEKIYGEISPFELKDKLIQLAEGQREKSARTMLNAGRGNPNWIAASPREAFFAFGQFAVLESRRVWNEHDLAGMPKKEGISNRFRAYIENHQGEQGIELLKAIIDHGITDEKFDPDAWIYELTDGVIGDNYPIPDRMLTHVEKVVHDYLIQEMCTYCRPEGKFHLFAVEGATAAMCYIFDSLIANKLLSLGDRVAVMVPVFTPYLEIPHLSRYNFDVVEINASEMTADGTHTWQYPEAEIEKLKDSSIKALFIVNPSNPPSVAMRPESVEQLVEIVNKYNPNLMIISDDVYGTFVNNFRSLTADLPFNTLGVYSFSKYFGVTGWRLGTIAIHENNVFDKLLKEMPNNKKEELRKRYGDLSTNPEDILFIDRIVADSRQVALNHTAGLSTPQQVQMAFFSVFALLDREDKYKQMTRDICRRRQKLLFDSLGLDLRKDPYDAAYYTEFDLLEWARHYYGTEFAEYLQKNHKPIDILFSLAEESSIVLLGGGGFHGPEWSIRISLSNLNDVYYSEIGEVLHRVLKRYVTSWKDEKNILVKK